MTDTLSPAGRSERMRAVRSTGNRSTEWRLRAALISRGVSGWELHAADLPGSPDFVFRRIGLAVFVDGCFWHSCPICQRPLPRAKRDYWRAKLKRNRVRATEVTSALAACDFDVIRVWEHDLRGRRLRLTVDNLTAHIRSRSKPR